MTTDTLEARHARLALRVHMEKVPADWLGSIHDALAIIDHYKAENERLRGEAAAYKRDFEAELAGVAAIRNQFGARANETFHGFVKRLHEESSRLRAVMEECALTIGNVAFAIGDARESGVSLLSLYSAGISLDALAARLRDEGREK